MPHIADSPAARCSLKALSVRSWVHTKCVWGLPASLAARAAASASSVMGMALAEPAGGGTQLSLRKCLSHEAARQRDGAG